MLPRFREYEVNKLRSPACSRLVNAIYSPHIHRTWEAYFSPSLYVILAYLISSEEEVEFPWLGVHGQPADEEGANLQ